MKEIKKNEVQTLEKNNIIKNTHKGFISTSSGYPVGFYRTRNKRYIEDKFADLAKSLS